jgi:hypothetical protein
MKRSRRRIWVTVAIVIGLMGVMTTYILTSFCFPALHRPIAYDGHYKGRVVEEQTREPIQGVVITAVWSYVCPTFAGPIFGFYDAYETTTDDQGNFTIPGRGLLLFIDLDRARVYIFKAGYDSYNYYWKSVSQKIRWEDDRAIIPLRKLTEEERRNSTPSHPLISADKMKLLGNEINKDRIERGLDPL